MAGFEQVGAHVLQGTDFRLLDLIRCHHVYRTFGSLHGVLEVGLDVGFSWLLNCAQQIADWLDGLLNGL